MSIQITEKQLLSILDIGYKGCSCHLNSPCGFCESKGEEEWNLLEVNFKIGK